MVIRDTYFDVAHSLVKNLKPSATASARQSTVLFQYALFAERQYQAVIDANETEVLKRDVEAKRREISDLDSMIVSQSKTSSNAASLRQLNHDRHKASILLEQDSQKFTQHVQKLDIFLQDAITLFADCLRLSDNYDEDVLTRLCSLWFRNFQTSSIQSYIGTAIGNIPSRKFVFFAHQLGALLSTSATGGQSSSLSTTALQELVLRLCREHPFHALYQVHSLRMGDGSKLGSAYEPASARRHAAGSLLNQLRGNTPLGERLRTIERICEAYIEWAIWDIPPPSKKDSGTLKMPTEAKLNKLRTTDTPIPTCWTPVDPTCEYKKVVGISRYASKYKTSGGINLPKINDCHGTDGKTYRQVVRYFFISAFPLL